MGLLESKSEADERINLCRVEIICYQIARKPTWTLKGAINSLRGAARVNDV